MLFGTFQLLLLGSANTAQWMGCWPSRHLADTQHKQVSRESLWGPIHYVPLAKDAARTWRSQADNLREGKVPCRRSCRAG